MTNEELKKRREKIGYTQKVMAEKLNMPPRTYQNYESTGKNRRKIPGWMEVSVSAVEKDAGTGGK